MSTNLFGFKNTAARWICCSAFIVSLVLLAVLGIGKDTPSAAAFDQVAAGAVFTGPQAELRFQSEPTTVTNTADNGAGSLRQAILNAESNAGVDVIDFQISGTGPHIIPLSSSLPSITESVVIDGCSQSGSICNSWPPTLMIVLDGSSLPDGAGLSLESSGSTVSGLVFQNFTRTGAIKLVGGVSTNNWIYTNYIGTNASGSTAAPNSNGIYIASGANGNIIGTNGDGADDAFERNLISGNTNAGILLEFSDTTNNTIAGNWIGTNYSGTAGIGNSVGVWVEQAVGNLIGTNADSHYDTDEGNLISGNGIGILLAESATTNIIAGNLIGTDEGGESDLGNTSAGIKLTTSAYDNVIGGESEAAGNTIAFNKNLGGVFLEMTEFTAAGSGNTIRYNLMSNNAGLGIELDSSIEAYSGAEPNENDEGDSDTGPNGLQNYPVLTSATPEELEGSLNSTPETTLTIDVYASDTCDPSGYGEGAIYVDNLNVVTNTSGYVNFSLTFPFSLTTDQYAVATATDPNGNTSEFSACILIENITVYEVTTIEDNVAGSLREAITLANADEGPGVIVFNFSSGAQPFVITPDSPLPAISERITIDGLTQSSASCDNWPPTLTVQLDGSAAGVGANGLTLQDGSYHLIRGLIISNFDGDGIALDGAFVTDSRVHCNFIGTNNNGTSAAGNGGAGVRMANNASNNFVGTNGDGIDDVSERNLISGNGYGVVLEGAQTRNNIVSSNYIGPDKSNSGDVGNTSAGIMLANGAHDNTIGARINVTGDTVNLQGNVIAYNGDPGGIYLAQVGTEAAGIRNTLRGNSLYSNDGLGIDLDNNPVAANDDVDHVTPNDSNDADSGPNALQNFPVLTTATQNSAQGTIQAKPSTQYRIDLYSNSLSMGCDDLDYGEAQTYLGTTIATTNSSGIDDFNIAFTAVPLGTTLTATATDMGGSTSEFSACFPVTSVALLGPGHYEQTHSAIAYSGTWLDASSASASGGTYKYTDDPNASATFNFYGGTVILYMSKGPGRGAAEICIDGSDCVEIDYYSPEWDVFAPQRFSGLGQGYHTITIENTPSSRIDLDAVEIHTAPVPIWAGTVDRSVEDTSAYLVYYDNWTAYDNSSGISVTYSDAAEAAVEFAVEVEQAGALFALEMTQFSDRGVVEVCIDDDPCTQVDSYGPSLVWGVPRPFRDLEAGLHYIEVRSVQPRIDIDRITVVPQVTPVGEAYYQNTDYRFEYDDEWYYYDDQDEYSITYSKSPTASMEFFLDGQSFSVYTTRYSNRGPLTVCVDGETPSDCTQVQNDNPQQVINVPHFFGGLADDVHTVIVKNTTTAYVDVAGVEGYARPDRGPLTEGFYENTDYRLVYTPGWKYYDKSGESFTYTNQVGDTVSFKVEGDAFALYMTRDNNRGDFEVCIDALPCKKRSNYSTSLAFGAPHLFKDLGASEHDVVVRNLTPGGWYLDLDAVQVYSVLTPLTEGFYENTEPRLNFTGTWKYYEKNGETFTYTGQVNDTVSFQMEGDAFALYMTQDVNRGNFEVCIDDVLPCTQLSNNGSLIFGVPHLFKDLIFGEHSVVVRNLTAGQYLDLDAVQVYSQMAPLTEGFYENTEGRLEYDGSWKYYDKEGESITYTNQVNDTLSFAVDGDAFVLYMTQDVNRGNFEVCIDDILPCTQLSNNGSLIFGIPHLFKDLGAGTHDVVVRNLSSGQYLDLDAIQVYSQVPPLTEGVYENTEPRLEYEGSWTFYDNQAGRTLTYTDTWSDKIKFQINGDILVLYMTQSPDRGEVDVCIDLVCQRIDNYSAQLNWAVPHVFSGLGNSLHNVEIRNVIGGLDRIDLDRVQVVSQLSPLSNGVHQNTSSSLGYYGTWSDYSSGGHTLTYTSQGGATASFRVYGEAFALIQTQDANRGDFEVCINDDPCVQLSNNGSLVFEVPHLFTGLASSQVHDVVVRNLTSGQYLDLDAVQVFSQLTPLTEGYYENTEPRLEYEGAWKFYESQTGRTLTYTDDVTATVDFQFEGDILVLYMTQSPDRGEVDVCIDADPCQRIDNYYSTTAWEVPQVFTDLGSGVHSVEIRNVSGGRNRIDLDKIRVLEELPVMSPGFYESDNSNILYSGRWSYFTDGIHTVTESNDPEAFAIFKFDSSEFGLYRTVDAYHGNINVCFDGETSCTLISNYSSSGKYWNVPYYFGVGAGEHTVRIYNMSAPNFYMDIDRLEIRVPGSEPPPGSMEGELLPDSSLMVIESDDERVDVAGEWTSYETSVASGGSYVYSSGSADDALSLNFTGTQLQVTYVKHPALGMLGIEVDGQVVASLDTSAADSEFGVSFYTNSLAPGEHTVRVYPVRGTIAVDSFGVEGVPVVESTSTATQPLDETFDTDTGWSPYGAWQYAETGGQTGGGWTADSTQRSLVSTLTSDGSIDLSGMTAPQLTYWQRGTLSSVDVLTVEISLEPGVWIVIDQQEGLVSDWRSRSVDLTPYRGQQARLRFKLDTTADIESGTGTEGYWIDDLVIMDR